MSYWYVGTGTSIRMAYLPLRTQCVSRVQGPALKYYISIQGPAVECHIGVII